MAIDDLTDKEFYAAFSSSPEIKGLFETYQRKYIAHPSQEGQPGYDKNNLKWYEEAKTDPEIISAVRDFIVKQQDGVEATTSPTHSAIVQGTGAATGRAKHAVGLMLVLIAIGLASMGVPYAPPLYQPLIL